MVWWIRHAVAAALLCLSVVAAAAPCAGFTDVDDTNAFCPNVTWIKNRNVTLGCEPGLYCPTAPVSRLAMAAFLHRLGNVVLPPNVIWVAPVGGQFQSIQAAIDHAAGVPGPVPLLVKVAPGVFVEQLTIPPNIVVEGSGRGFTEIRAQGGCAAGAPSVGGVTLNENAQLRNVHVSLFPLGPGDCATIVIANGVGVALKDVLVRIEGTAPVNYGVRILAADTDNPLVLENVEVRASASFASSARLIGVSLSGVPQQQVVLRDVDISSVGPDAIGLGIANVGVRLDRARVSTIGTALSTLTALSVNNALGVLVENSALQTSAGGTAVANTGSGTVRIASSLVDGSITGTTSCFGAYGPNMSAVAC